ncbi:MAG: efflux RND transporter periplasmic adaptor subunit [Bryobacteraceae bacterium]
MSNRGLVMAQAAVLLLAGCGEGPGPAPGTTVEATSPPAVKQDHPSNEIHLTAAAVAEAGIRTQPAAVRAGYESIEATGRLTVNEDRTWRVGAVTEGRVTRVDARVGDRVTAGQTLAYLHTHDVHEARADYQKAKSEMTRLRSQEAHAIRVRDRARKLYELKAGSLEALEHAEVDVKDVQQRIVQSEAEIERVRTHLAEFLGVNPEEPDSHEPGKHDIEDWVPVRTPAAGVVVERNVSAGSVVPAAGSMFTVTDPSMLWMLASVGEEHYSLVRLGMAVAVRVQAHPGREFRGRVTKLGEQLDPETRTVQARIELANPTGLLKPEMYATAELRTAGRRDTLTVPESALQELKGQAVVFVDRGEGRFEAVAVETGGQSQGNVEIRGGLDAGDRVVVQGAFLVKSQLLKGSLEEE